MPYARPGEKIVVFVFLLIALVVVIGAVTLAVVGGRENGPLADAPPDRLHWPLPADRPLNRADVQAVRLPPALRGYRMADVDDVLERLGAELAERDARIVELEYALARAGAGTTGYGYGSPAAEGGDRGRDGRPAGTGPAGSTVAAPVPVPPEHAPFAPGWATVPPEQAPPGGEADGTGRDGTGQDGAGVAGTGQDGAVVPEADGTAAPAGTPVGGVPSAGAPEEGGAEAAEDRSGESQELPGTANEDGTPADGRDGVEPSAADREAVPADARDATTDATGPGGGTDPGDGAAPQDEAGPEKGTDPQDGTGPEKGTDPQDGTGPEKGTDPQDGAGPEKGAGPQDETGPEKTAHREEPAPRAQGADGNDEKGGER
ncbi:DivIVA domain-containing protein [Streptomyces pactum]|uniref:DivIVA domain-containing protein n=1 Tax=Streptomyces pactum TaxID=68249 RepID=UPI0035570F66